MTTYRNYLSVLLLTLAAMMSFTGCEEDYDPRFVGEWRIVEVTPAYNTNYRPGDYWRFYPNGDFEVYGSSWEGNLNEYGYWDRRGNNLQITFDGYNTDINARIRGYDGDYMVLDVSDYYYNSRYTLRLIRTDWY